MNGTGLLTLIGSSGGGLLLLGILFRSFNKKLDNTTTRELCEEKHKTIDQRLEKLDEIHEAVIWMQAKMNRGDD